ncbi:MAG TPA: helix-turn-helix domain-containing protein [Acidimicrobiales bacterium]|nr:helix-turn-helix domain-containing protein [Acidimicrobiales bacterium]
MAERSLRQRKKDRTRARLIEVSQRLFAEQGYDATTLEQICDEAEVSVPTLLAYFESKERLALTPDYDTLEAFRAQVDDPERRQSTVELWRAHVLAAVDVATRPRGAQLRYLRHYRYQASSPAFVRGTVALLQQYEDVLAAGLARDFGTDPDRDLTTRLMATTLIFGDHMVVRRWVASGGQGDLAAVCNEVIDVVVATFRPAPRSATVARRAR